MSSAQSNQTPQLSLPTGWLIPPPGLLPASHPIKIEPVPIAISVTLAFIVGAVVIIFLCRKDKDVFLEGRVVRAPKNKKPTAAARHGDDQNRRLVATKVPEIRHPSPSRAMPEQRQPGLQQAPKVIAKLGWDFNGNPQPESSRIEYPEDQPPPGHQQYYDPNRDSKYDSDDETLNEYKRNSAYWEMPQSEVGEPFDKEMRARYGTTERSRASGSVRHSPFGLASNTWLGDAY
ncbi:hypothetical protein CC86DRAFT_384756 [Ophiobolus disseminans]|uniref:Uncharacterized protein n=1 Tax=Ophiobolus disseminans TaxID=1469910 RepID=A0A6A6ZQP5_9PLEO|nr:hypothetical protein CC86DRAFT_384756 [Ophiobolus disseminans]